MAVALASLVQSIFSQFHFTEGTHICNVHEVIGNEVRGEGNEEEKGKWEVARNDRKVRTRTNIDLACMHATPFPSRRKTEELRKE